MSGILGTIINGASVIGTVQSLLTGGSPVTLDDIEFQSWEVPERVKWGGAQSLAVHQFPGGARTIDAMGSDEAPITWSGRLGILTPDSASRARRLDTLRQSGAEVVLTWGEFTRSVVVASCEFDHGFDFGYQISVTVIPDDADNQSAPSLLDQVNGDLSSALGFDVGGTLSDVMSGVQAVTSVLPSLTGGSAATGGLLASLGNLTGQLQTAGNAASALFGGLATGDGNLLSGVGSLGSALSAATSEVGLTSALSYVKRVATNVASI